MTTAIDQIRTTRQIALDDISGSREITENFMGLHPEFCTPVLFEKLKKALIAEIEKKNNILEAVVRLCDCLIAEREEQGNRP